MVSAAGFQVFQYGIPVSIAAAHRASVKSSSGFNR